LEENGGETEISAGVEQVEAEGMVNKKKQGLARKGETRGGTGGPRGNFYSTLIQQEEAPLVDGIRGKRDDL